MAMLVAYGVAEVLGRRMQSELRKGFPPPREAEADAAGQSHADPSRTTRAELPSAPNTGADPVAKPPAEVVIMTEVLAEGPPVRQRLGYPAVLEPLYEGLRQIPGSGWDFEIEAVGIEQFDDPDELLRMADTLPLMETPIFALLNARRKHPGKFKVLTRNFSAGSSTHPPFRFVGRRNGRPAAALDIEDLCGRTIGVIGHYMSPTVTLSAALRKLGVDTKIWRTSDWSERTPSDQRLDLLVSETMAGQHHALKSKQVDWALVIYPYTHDSYASRFADPTMEHVKIEPLESLMSQLLASQTLNVLVTRSDWYEGNRQWRVAVDGLMENVLWKNRILEEDEDAKLIHAAGQSVEETVLSGEIEFDTRTEGIHSGELRKLDSVGAGAGLWPEAA
ncbi:MAG TPA: hypothetical protein VFM51_03420 [Solirubrobacterales bacterium]|nr:hypothetical protein [Solirubrobacterales bacterium]